ncbi:MAG: hypothetical protein V4685_15585 [Bacteroidota bacterium]
MKQITIVLFIGFVCCNSIMKKDQGIEKASFEFIKGICFKDRATLDRVVDDKLLASNLSSKTNGSSIMLNDFYSACYVAYSPWKIQQQNFEKLRDSFSMKDCRFTVNLLRNDSTQVKAVWNCVYDKSQKDSIELSLIKREKWVVTNVKLPSE